MAFWVWGGILTRFKMIHKFPCKTENTKFVIGLTSCYENCEEVIYDYIVTSNPIKAGDWCADDITALTGMLTLNSLRVVFQPKNSN